MPQDEQYYLPSEYGVQGIEHLVQWEIKGALQAGLADEVSLRDISRASIVKMGARQENPQGVVVLIYANDPMSPEAWKHKPDTRRIPGLSWQSGPQGGVEGRQAVGHHLVGGGDSSQLAFTVEIQVWGRKLPGTIEITRDDVDDVLATVVARAKRKLKDVGFTFGTGQGILDEFGNLTIGGPFFGEAWESKQAGEALTAKESFRVWYTIASDWDTSKW